MCRCVRMKLVENLGVSTFLSQIVTLPHVANSMSARQQIVTSQATFPSNVTPKHSILCIFCPVAWNAPELNIRLLIHVLMMCVSFGNKAPCGT